MIDWLYQTTLDVSLLIGLVLLLRPLVRRTLGARAAYWLWFLPLVRAALPSRPARPTTILDVIPLPGGQIEISIFPNPDVALFPAGLPIVSIWIAGILIWAIFRSTAWIRFRRLLDRGSEPCNIDPAVTLALPDKLRTPDPRYFSCRLDGAPFVTGFVRPLIFLPPDFASRYTEEEQKCVLHHELMHFARKDLWMQTLWETLRGIFWFNPIVHIAAIALRDDQELACDQSVLAGSTADDRYHYGKALMVGSGPQLVPPTMAFPGRQKERVLMIPKHRRSPMRSLVGIALCGLVGLFSLTKAPVSVSQEALDSRLTISLQDMPLEHAIGLFATMSGTEISGIERVQGRAVTIRVEDVPVRDVLMKLLNCVGYTFESRSDGIDIIPLRSPADAEFECLGVEILEQA